MHKTKAHADVEIWDKSAKGGSRRARLIIYVTFEFSLERRAGEGARHGSNVRTHENMSGAHRRQGGGSLGAGWLGNQMLNQFDGWEREARDKALEAVGVRPFWRADTEEEFSALKRRFESLQGQTVHVVLD